jgi:hypothetical protein
MPGLLNSFRSPTSPDLLQKFFGARKSLNPERSKLSRRETEGLMDHIASTRTQIFALEGRVESLQGNTLTVCCSIQHKQPGFTPPIVIRLPEISQGPAVTSSLVEASPNKPRRKWFSIALLRPHSTSSDNKLEIPAALNKYPTDVSEAERDILSPASISFEDMALTADGESDLQVQLDLLALQKAELEVEVMKLEVNLLFWEGLYKQVQSVYRQEVKEEARRKSHFSSWRPSTPSSLGQWAFNAHSIPSEYTKGRGSDTSRNLSILRKGVPIREMIVRIKSTTLFLFRPGTRRDYSWSEYDDLSLPEAVT